jgi:uncharacterized protein (TIGR01777 family)
MKVILTGASGFVGRALSLHLAAQGHDLVCLSRRAANGPGWQVWRPMLGAPSPEIFDGADAVIHLAGEPVAQHWSYAVKRRIRASRVEATAALVESIARCARPPRTLISASAIGFYGDRGEEELTEASAVGRGFLAGVCAEWENAANYAENYGVRVVSVRISAVLHPSGGALAKMLPPFRLGLGGPIAGGRAWMSWIHLADLVRLIAWTLECEQARGPVNAAAPEPVRNGEFTRALAAALHRPAFFPIPALALKLLYGEMAEVILASQRVLPSAALKLGFRFDHPQIGPALRDLLA